MTRSKTLRTLSVILLCLLALAQLVGCGDGYRMTMKDGSYYIRATGVYYKPAPLTYKYDGGSELYYKIAANVDPEQYIALVFEDYVSGLMHAADLTLPTFREFDADRALITTNTEVWASMGEAKTKEDVDFILDAFEAGERVQYPASEALETYRIMFTSEKFPAFTMTLRYYYYGEGRTYLYDIGTRECRVVPDGILDDFLPDDDGGVGV